jgi:hypothetical protein
MGANAQTSVPAFVTGQVLTAQQQTEINTGIPVFADSAARDAAFGGTGEKVLAEGQYAFLEDTNATQVYDGASWEPVGVSGLTYITQATPSAVQSVSINDCFSSAYANYLLVIDTTATVGAGYLMARLRLSGADATTNYSSQRIGAQNSSTFANADVTGTEEFLIGSIDSGFPGSLGDTVNIFSPALARVSVATSLSGTKNSSGPLLTVAWSHHTTATAYDGITIFTDATSFTGTIRIYGYQNS